MCQGPGVRERDEGGSVWGGGMERNSDCLEENGGRPTHMESAGSLGCPRSPSAASCDRLARKRKISFLFLESFAIWETFPDPFFASYDKPQSWGCEHG